MNIAELLKKNVVMVPVVASLIVGTFTGVKYIVSLTETINQNRDQIAIINDTHLKNQIGYIARIQENQSHLLLNIETNLGRCLSSYPTLILNIALPLSMLTVEKT